MFKIGHKVSHFRRMDIIGEIIDIYKIKTNYYSTGGTLEATLIAKVEFLIDGQKQIKDVKLQDLIRVYD